MVTASILSGDLLGLWRAQHPFVANLNYARIARIVNADKQETHIAYPSDVG
jgi:hypothetical protein